MQALLTIEWPEALQFHAKSGVRISLEAPDPGKLTRAPGGASCSPKVQAIACNMPVPIKTVWIGTQAHSLHWMSNMVLLRFHVQKTGCDDCMLLGNACMNTTWLGCLHKRVTDGVLVQQPECMQSLHPSLPPLQLLDREDDGSPPAAICWLM